jgi:ribosomal protein L32E
MKNRSERLVVFVTPAQKRAIATRAQEVGISVSELLRRAVLAFDVTAGQVRAARIVDNWRAGHAADALNETLRRIAGKAAPARPALSEPAALRVCEPSTRQPVPVAAAVAQVLESRREGGDDMRREGKCLDEQTVARITARWAVASGHDAGNAPAFDDAAHVPAARRVRTGS